MPLYAVAITPLLRMIKSDDAHNVRHVAFADDLGFLVVLVDLQSCVPGGIISLFMGLVWATTHERINHG